MVVVMKAQKETDVVDHFRFLFLDRKLGERTSAASADSVKMAGDRK